MTSRPWHAHLTMIGIVALTALAVVAPAELRARQRPAIADFAPPMTPAEAQAAVSAARAAERALRSAQMQQQPGGQEAVPLPSVQNMYFASSGFHISDRTGFLSFWRRNGGELIFGYPISGEMVEDGRIVQYFERARFEYHPEHLGTDYQVMLSLVGNELTQGRDFPDGQPVQGRIYFPETRQTLGGKFLKFWEKRGGLRIFGYPISEPFEEISPIDGQMRITQYFERARFEYHPELLPAFYRQMERANGITLAGLYEVQLTDLGRQAMQRRGYTPQSFGPMPGAPVWSSALFERRIEVNLSTQMLTAFEGDVPVYRAPVATGRDGFNTPAGTFAIYAKLPMQTMTGSAGGESWYVPDIPWVQYVVGGVALHGTYWHDAWGTGVRMSHGCINLNIDDAEWLYRWADIGTRVDIRY
ncbi:L,D-transpeptidase [Roseiflexus sp.]|uniref:L,D-transpeptidase n=1 Tax=Roseiflexus sp. TaxID=2562120 RepID=UPI00398AFF34